MSALTNEQELAANAREREHRELDDHGSHFWRCVPLVDAIAALDAAEARETELEETIAALRSAVETEWYNGNMSEDTFARIDRVGAEDVPLAARAALTAEEKP